MNDQVETIHTRGSMSRGSGQVIRNAAVSRETSPQSQQNDYMQSQISLAPAFKGQKNAMTLSGDCRPGHKKSSKVAFKLRWTTAEVGNDDDETSLMHVPTAVQQLSSKDVRPVVRQGQHFTQVNLKLKGNFVGSSKSKQSNNSSRAQQMLAVQVGSSAIPKKVLMSPQASRSNRQNIFSKQGAMSQSDSAGSLMTLRQKIMRNDKIERVEARRQAAEYYHPEKIKAEQEAGQDVTQYTDNFMTTPHEVRQIPGNYQDMNVLTSPPHQFSHARKNSDFVQIETTPLTSTPMLDFRNSQLRQAEINSESSASAKQIKLSQKSFNQMQFLPPTTNGTGFMEENSKKASISSDQERMKRESKLQKLRKMQAEVAKSNGDESQKANVQGQQQVTLDPKSNMVAAKNNLVDDLNDREQVNELIDSFVDERCSPIENSINYTQNNFSMLRSVSRENSNKDRRKLPFVFNDLQRENFEMVIGDKKRRELVIANHKNRKVGHPHSHARNHSELLQAQFRKEGMMVQQTDQETAQNDKLNIDGNDGIGNITSSSEGQGRAAALQSPKSASVIDVEELQKPKLDDTSLGDCEVDEDTDGRGKYHLDQQISTHTIGISAIGGRSQPAANSDSMRRHQMKTSSDFQFLEQDDGNQERHFSASGVLRSSRLDKTPEGRTLNANVQFQQYLPSSYSNFGGRNTATDVKQHFSKIAAQNSAMTKFPAKLQQNFSGTEEEPCDEQDYSMQQVSMPGYKLSQNASIGSQLVPITMAKRRKHTSNHSVVADPTNDFIFSGKTLPLLENPIQQDEPSQLLSHITVNNYVGQQNNKDQKQLIRNLSANNRSDHFSDSQVVIGKNGPNSTNMNESSREDTEHNPKLLSHENIVSSVRIQPTNCKQPNVTEMVMRASQETLDGFRLSLSKTDNKGMRLNRSAMGNSNRGDTHELHTKYSEISPLQTQNIGNSQRDSIGPKPMGDFKGLRMSHRKTSWQLDASLGAVDPNAPEVMSAISNQYLMSSIGNTGEDPAGVFHMYKMREFMQEPGASKQISVQKNYQHQQLMQRQRKIRGQSSRNQNKIGQQDSHDLMEQTAEDNRGSMRQMVMLTDQKHAQKRQKSLVSGGRASDNGSAMGSSNLPQDFSITENEVTGEVKLKILRRDIQYVPREVLQDASIFSQVTVLDICNCRIVELEGRIFSKLQNLTKLHAARNQIKYLSGRISECQYLNHINLECNLLEMIPSEIGQLHNSLVVLKLSSNKLKKLTLSTRELINLEVLTVSENCLTDLPDGMENLESLVELHMAGNPLTSFNVMIGRMPKLNKLTLDWFTFLIPSLPVLTVRLSNFDIEREMHDVMLANRTSNGLSSILISTMPIKSTIEIQRDGTIAHSSRSRAGDSQGSTIVQPTGLVLQGLTLAKMESIFSSEDEAALNIASERNNQPAAGLTAQIAHQTNSKLDVFRELAILIEENSGKSPLNKKRHGLGYGGAQNEKNSSETGINFITFAEHFYKKAHGDRLPQQWMSLCDSKGRTMMHYTAQKGDMQATRLLVEAGADKTKVDQYQFNAYGLALREEHFSVAMYLLTTPSYTYFDVYRGAGTFGSLLHLAVTKMQAKQVSIILQHEVSPNTVDQVSGDTPLHVLVNLYHKQPETSQIIMRNLHEFGADFNARNRFNWTPFHLAVKRGNLSAIRAMLDVAGNKTQKSWLSVPSRGPDYVDIDALGGPNMVSALHLAGENNYYDIIDLMFQYKADLFVQDERGNTPFTSISNNLLMIKLIKKEQRAQCNERFKPQRLQAKELHFTNSIFVKQALREHQIDDPILAAHMNGKYSTMRSTLGCVNQQLQVPLQSHKRVSSRNDGVHAASPGDFTISAEKLAPGPSEYNDNTNEERKGETSILGLPKWRASSPTPISFANLARTAQTTIKRRGSIPARETMALNSRNIIFNHQLENPHFSGPRATSSIKLLPAANLVSNDIVNLNNLIVRQMGQSESPSEILLPGNGPTPVFAGAPKNSMNESVDFLNDYIQELPTVRVSLSDSLTADPIKLRANSIKKNDFTLQGSERQLALKLKSNISRKSNQSIKIIEKSAKLDQKVLLSRDDPDVLSQTISIASPLNANGPVMTLGRQPSVQMPGEETLEFEAAEMDYDTIELKESNIGGTPLLKQQDVTFKEISIKVDQKVQQMPQKKVNQRVTQQHGVAESFDLSSVLDGLKSPPKRQASEKAPAQRHKLPAENMNNGDERESSEVRLTVNASKNLFGCESQKYDRKKILEIGKSSNEVFTALISQRMRQNKKTSPIAVGRDQKLRDQKNANIFSQQMKYKLKPQQAAAAKQQQQPQLQPMTIAPQNIFFKDDSEKKGELQVLTLKQAAALHSLVSPTAIVDDDLPYAAIEMPEHQPIFKMGNVITNESVYSSQGRINSNNSRKSSGSNTSGRKRGALEQLLNANFRPSTSDKSSQRRMYNNSARLQQKNPIAAKAQKTFLSSLSQSEAFLKQQQSQQPAILQDYIPQQQQQMGNTYAFRSHSMKKQRSPSDQFRQSSPNTNNVMLLSSDRIRQAQPMVKTQIVPQKPRLQFKQLVVPAEHSKSSLNKYLPPNQPSLRQDGSNSKIRVSSLQSALLSSNARPSQIAMQQQELYFSSASSGIKTAKNKGLAQQQYLSKSTKKDC